MKYRFVLVLSVLLIAATSMIVGKEDVYCEDRYGRINAPDHSTVAGGTSEYAGTGGNGATTYQGGSANLGGATNSEGRIRDNRVNRSREYVTLSRKKLSLRKGESCDLWLWINSNTKVQWSSSSSIVKLKRERNNKVIISYRKHGKCYVKAKYRGRTFVCEIICQKGPYKNIMEIATRNPSDYFENRVLKLDCTSTVLDCGSVLVRIPNKRLKFDVHSLSYSVEDPNIVTCEWVDLPSNSFVKPGRNLLVGALRPGTTRIIIYNNYNKEKEYITVDVEASYMYHIKAKNMQKPLVEAIPGYSPIGDEERGYNWWGYEDSKGNVHTSLSRDEVLA